MKSVQQFASFLDEFAPIRLAEEWDNVGLLVGDPQAGVERVMTCLTITPESAAEAIENSANLIVTHHPLPFHPLKRITTETVTGKILWDLIRAGIAIYSPHTAFDSAREGINQKLAESLGLTGIVPLKPMVQESEPIGAGRIGKGSMILQELIEKAKKEFGLSSIQFVGDLKGVCKSVAVACGSGGSFLSNAERAGCDTFVTGEASFHTCLEAKAKNISLVLLGHYASERFGLELLADRLTIQFPDLKVWASKAESDPVSIV